MWLLEEVPDDLDHSLGLRIDREVASVRNHSQLSTGIALNASTCVLDTDEVSTTPAARTSPRCWASIRIRCDRSVALPLELDVSFAKITERTARWPFAPYRPE